MLFIEGKPGSGKSTLVQYFRDSFGSQSRDGIVAGFFYSHRDGELERSHYNMLRSLLYDILSADESFFVHFQEAFRRCGSVTISWPYKLLKDILVACGKHPLKRTVYLIVDALDESVETDRRNIVRLLQELSDSKHSRCVVKIFLASRPINELHHELMDTNSLKRIRLQEKNREDIERYTDTFLGDRVFQRAQGFRERAKVYILQHADGVFLWVALIRKDLERFANHGRNVNQLMAYLKELPKELESYYIRMLEGLLSNNCHKDDIRDGRRILYFCLFSHRAVELVELCDALAIPDQILDTEPDVSSWEEEKPTDIRNLVTQCAGNFVEIRYRYSMESDGKSRVDYDMCDMHLSSSRDREICDCSSYASDGARVYPPPS